MLDLFYQGGPLFMGILTLILITMLVVSITTGTQLMRSNVADAITVERKVGYTRSVGLFALIIGMLGQLIGLFSAFKAIEVGAVQVSPALIAGGFKVSMITTLYGLIIYALSFIIWLGFTTVLTRK